MENKIPYQVILKITNNYDEKRILGSGGFGTVYKGIQENGETIAVKLFDALRFDDSEFQKEFDNLKRLKHDNIVGLVGFCNDMEEVYAEVDGKQVPAVKLHMALCLEYAQNGSLRDYISDESKGLNWHTRYKIIKGVCEGLKYLREGIDPPILHLDLKPENILLGKDMVPKVADFGLSRLFGEQKTTKTASAMGTNGYLPPEYIEFQVVSEKFDIYSLGVIMAKTITGCDHFYTIDAVSRKKYINEAHDKWRKQLCRYLTSASLEVYCRQVRRCVELALDCMKKNRQERPTIQEIISNLIETETIIGNLGLNMEQIDTIIRSKIDMTDNPSPGPDRHVHLLTSDVLEPLSRPAFELEFSQINFLMNGQAKELPFHFLKKATNNFSSERKVGEHTFGTIYKGLLEDGQLIAVVQFKPESAVARDRTFPDKVQALSGLDHKNIVKVHGYCREAGTIMKEINGRYIVVNMYQTLLCYEYFMAGSLPSYIYGEYCRLDWNMSFKIIMGICQGLEFLHSRKDIHRDLQPENIFFDNNMVPKISGFGLHDINTWIGSLGLSGSIEYMAPECQYSRQVSTMSDIYSLGIIILAITTGEGNHCTADKKHSRGFIDHVYENWRDDEYIMFMYPSLDEFYIHHIRICIEMGLMCVELDQEKRPSILTIVGELSILSEEGAYMARDVHLKQELLEVHPQELYFPFEPKIPISCSLQITNKGDDHVAFMLVSENPKKYLTKLPLCGVLPYRCTYTHIITTHKQPQQQPSVSHEFFTLHALAVGKFDLQDLDTGSIAKEYLGFFNKAKTRHWNHGVQEVRLRVTCDPPTQEATIFLRWIRSRLLGQFLHKTIKIITTKNAQQVSCIDVHPTEPWIITTHKWGDLHFWNYNTMETLVSFEALTEEAVHFAKFVEPEKWLVASDANGGIHVYSYDNLEEVKFFRAHDSCITSLDLHPTRPFLLSSSEDEDHLIKLWDWDKNWQCIRTFQGHADKVMQVKFNSISMGSFTSASLDGTAKIWSTDTDDGDIITFDEEGGSLLCIDNFEQCDRRHMIAGCKDGSAKIWNMEIKGCVQKLEGHAQHITVVNWHPELRMLITGSLDGTVRLWNSDTYKLEDIINFNLGQVYAFGFIKDLRRIMVGCQHGIATMQITAGRR